MNGFSPRPSVSLHFPRYSETPMEHPINWKLILNLFVIAVVILICARVCL